MTIRLGRRSDRIATPSSSEALRGDVTDDLPRTANAESELARDRVNVRRETIMETHA
jgi:hypothetical protein